MITRPSLPCGLPSSTIWFIAVFCTCLAILAPISGNGYNGNSFIAAWNFVKRVKAKSVATGGQSLIQLQNILLTRPKCILMAILKMYFFKKIAKACERKISPRRVKANGQFFS